MQDQWIAARRAALGRRRLASVALLVTACALCSVPAHAGGGDSAVAEVLFEEGRALLERGQVSEACKKFAESHRLDPATGTLLGLALCHEQEGKLASAWAEFVEVESAAARERQRDREEFARERAGELRPRLSTLTISVPPEVASQTGLEVKRNGEVVGAGAFNVAAPIDGGEYEVSASAPGKTTWSVTVHVATEKAAETVEVPALEDAPVAAVTEPPPVATSAAPATPEEPPRGFFDLTALQWSGVGAAAGGVLALGAGGYFLSSALGKKSDSDAHCDGNQCNPEGAETRREAVADGNLATLLGITGAVLVGAGVTLYFVGAPDEPSAAAPTWTLHAGGTPDAAFATLNGRF